MNAHPLISKYFKVLGADEMIPAEYRKAGFVDFLAPGTTWDESITSMHEDEFYLDPTRMTLVCGTAGFDGTQFKSMLADDYDIQVNKTSRNSVLLQSNINNTRSDVAQLIRVLMEICNEIEEQLAEGGEDGAGRLRQAHQDADDGRAGPAELQPLPRRLPQGCGQEDGRGRHADGLLQRLLRGRCEYVALNGAEIDARLKKGPELVSANFVIPYPPGFPIMVPGQVMTQETIDFMRKLDVKEIHGYEAGQGSEADPARAPARITGRK